MNLRGHNSVHTNHLRKEHGHKSDRELEVALIGHSSKTQGSQKWRLRNSNKRNRREEGECYNTDAKRTNCFRKSKKHLLCGLLLKI
jgi:hypothetical protein